MVASLASGAPALWRRSTVGVAGGWRAPDAGRGVAGVDDRISLATPGSGAAHYAARVAQLGQSSASALRARVRILPALALPSAVLGGALLVGLLTLTSYPPVYGDEAYIGSTAWGFLHGHGFRPAVAALVAAVSLVSARQFRF